MLFAQNGLGQKMSPRDCKAPYKGLYRTARSTSRSTRTTVRVTRARPGDPGSGSGAPGGAPGSPIQSLVWSLTVPRGHFLSQPILSKEHLIGALDYIYDTTIRDAADMPTFLNSLTV